MTDRTRRVFLILLAGWGGYIVYGTTLPFDLELSRLSLRESWAQAHWLVWEGPRNGRPSPPDLILNLLLFLPWGFCLAAAAAGRARGRTLLLAVSTAVVLSAAVEFLQLFSARRLTAGSDLAANALGALIGAWSVEPLKRRWAARLEAELHQRPQWMAVWAAVSGAMVVALSPFDPCLDARQLEASLAATRWLPWGPFSTSEAVWATRVGEVLWASLAAGLIGWAVRGSCPNRVSRWGKPLAATLLLVTATEGVQLGLRSRAADVHTLAMALVGAVAGIWIVERRAAMGLHSLLRWAIAIWAAALFVRGIGAGLSGSTAAGPPVTMLWLDRLIARATVHSLAEPLVQTLLYLPLGGALGLGSRSLRRSVAIGVGFALAVEVVAVRLTPGPVDLGRVLFAGAGVSLGAWSIQELRRARRIIGR